MLFGSLQRLVIGTRTLQLLGLLAVISGLQPIVFTLICFQISEVVVSSIRHVSDGSGLTDDRRISEPECRRRH